MADPARHVQFNINEDIIIHDNQGNDDNDDCDNQNTQNNQNALNNQGNNDQAWQVVQLNAPTGAQMTLAFKVEQSKIPEFYGQKSKDNIMAIIFIRKIDNLARTNRWNNTTTYTNVANTLKGFARDWLFATVEMLDWEGDMDQS